MKKLPAGQQYKSINTQTGIVDADPHRLIQMLFAGALEQILVAKGCMQRADVAGKGEAISKAIGIVGGLLDSVNEDAEQKSSDATQLGTNLTALYTFVTRRLSDANIANDELALDESANVLRELQSGWNDIRAEVLAQPSSESIPV
ncbi:MAG: flagellar export chaperone FliS [Cellvibrionales bacterium]|nr:flagellar export chaperone FliS [Cellvibrionales bacterium]